jgi:hypothetical protein
MSFVVNQKCINNLVLRAFVCQWKVKISRPIVLFSFFIIITISMPNNESIIPSPHQTYCDFHFMQEKVAIWALDVKFISSWDQLIDYSQN